MVESLGILVSSDKHLDYVVNLTKAAYAKGKTVSLFFTGKGVLLTMQPQFKELVGKAKLSVCDVSFRANGLHGREEEVPGVGFKDFATQARNAEMLARSDRYLVF
jgi:predicted peroxiredoxin